MATDELVLGRDQQRVYDRALSGDNLLITGPAGTGKSVLLRAIVEGLRDSGRRVAVTASTGVAALNVGGSTIHSFLGTGIKGSVDEVKEGRVRVDDWMSERLKRPDVLILDEVSMCSGDYLGLIDYWCGHVRQGVRGGVAVPFGGLQVILVGDFLQLPPVITRDQRVKDCFAFQSPAWTRGGFAVELLREHFRQADPAFAAHLGRIRVGELAPSAADFFAPCVRRPLDAPTNLYGKNDDANAHNREELAKIDGAATTYAATYWHRFDDLGDRCTEPQRARRARDLEKLAEHCIADATLALKPGAPVLCLVNDREIGIVNGMRGVVLECGPGYARVRTERERTVELVPHRWEQKDHEGEPIATLTQLPLKLAWAMTIHKAQGLTLSSAYCDLRVIFAGGQTYVALSRVRTVDGLALSAPLTARQVRADPMALAFYRQYAPDSA